MSLSYDSRTTMCALRGSSGHADRVSLARGPSASGRVRNPEHQQRRRGHRHPRARQGARGGHEEGASGPPPAQSADVCAQADEKTDASAVVEGAAATGETDVTMADASAAASTSAPAVAAAQEQPEASTSSGKPKRAGIVLAAEKRVTSKLLDSEAGGGREKIFGINECVLGLGCR